MTSVESRVDELIEKHPGLCAALNEGGSFVLCGDVRIDAVNEGYDYIVRDVPTRMIVPYDNPENIPKVWVEDKQMLEGYEHVFSDGSLCLGARGELALGLQRNCSLVDFFEGVVVGNLYAIEYHRMYGCMPSGDRSHGSVGILEAYRELFEVDDSLAAIRLLAQATGNLKYRGHLACECGSGLRARDCHGPLILEINRGSCRKAALGDFEDIYKAWVNTMMQKEKRDRGMDAIKRTLLNR